MQEYKAPIPTSVKAIANMIEDSKHALKETENRIKGHDADLERLEAELERQMLVQERILKEIHKMKLDLEAIKTSAAAAEQKNPAVRPPVVETAPSAPSYEAGRQLPEKKPIVSAGNQPIMKGNGFSHITVDYLKKLKNK